MFSSALFWLNYSYSVLFENYRGHKKTGSFHTFWVLVARHGQLFLLLFTASWWCCLMPSLLFLQIVHDHEIWMLIWTEHALSWQTWTCASWCDQLWELITSKIIVVKLLCVSLCSQALPVFWWLSNWQWSFLRIQCLTQRKESCLIHITRHLFYGYMTGHGFYGCYTVLIKLI